MGRWLGLLLWLVAGCATGRPHVDRELAKLPGPARTAAADSYKVGCPDVLEVKVEGQPGLSGPRAIGPDGRIDLGRMGRLRVEGCTLNQVARYLGYFLTVSPEQVQVQVARFNSQRIYLMGEVAGSQRSVPYEGPEKVVDLLQRAGGINPGAAPQDVHVVRAQVAEGKQPEVFDIELQDIVEANDQSTNIVLRPFDQIYVGETRPSSLRNCVPAFVRPIYDAVFGLRKPSKRKAEAPGQGPQMEKTRRPGESATPAGTLQAGLPRP